MQLVSVVAGIRPRGFTADDVADAREALEHARRNLDRVLRDLVTVQKERDEALTLIRPLRPSMHDEAAPRPTVEEREAIWAKLDELKRRAAETDKQIEEHEEDIALLIERLQRLRRRLLRYC